MSIPHYPSSALGVTTTALACSWCGMHHEHACPRVKKMKYHPDGTIKSIEFFPVIGTHSQNPLHHIP